MLASGVPRARVDMTASEGQSAVRQKQVRLSEEQQAELVARHEACAFKEKLARIYGIHVETVQAIIRPRMQAHCCAWPRRPSRASSYSSAR
ncbi:hypothetical protein J2X46_001753 [Nocardioides sp. BE266]|nr:hypothetical protein [Nocardioides sp. BE266]